MGGGIAFPLSETDRGYFSREPPPERGARQRGFCLGSCGIHLAALACRLERYLGGSVVRAAGGPRQQLTGRRGERRLGGSVVLAAGVGGDLLRHRERRLGGSVAVAAGLPRDRPSAGGGARSGEDREQGEQCYQGHCEQDDALYVLVVHWVSPFSLVHGVLASSTE